MLFANPKALMLMAMAVPCLALMLLWGLRRRAMLMRRFGQWIQVSRLLANARRRVHAVRAAIWVLAVSLIFLAVARPKFGDVEETVLARGVDVIIAVDTSSSMLANDIEPTRLARAKEQLSQLISRLRGHRIGLIAFAGTSMLQCPLTLDQTILHQMLDLIDQTSVGVPGTAIANSVQLAVRSFDPDSSRHRVLVLLTDGEDHEGDIAEAAQEAAEAGVKIYAIGIGTDSGATVPEYDRMGRQVGFRQRPDGSPILTRLDTLSLLNLASETGGRAFETASLGQVEVDIIAREVNNLPQSELEEEQIQRKEDQFQLFLLPAIILLLLDVTLLSGRMRRRRIARSAAATTLLLAALMMPGVAHAEDSAAELNNRGVSLLRSGDLDGALEVFQQAQVEDPNAAAIGLNMGNLFHEQGDLEEAENQFSRAAMRNDPDLASDAQFNLGTVRIRQAQELADDQDLQGAIDKIDDAIGSLRASLLSNSDSPDAQANLEMANGLRERWERQQQQQMPQNQDQQQSQQGQQNQQQQQQQQEQDQQQGQQDEQNQQDQQQQGQQDQQQQGQQDQQQQDQQSGQEQQQNQQQQGQQQQDQNQQQQQDQPQGDSADVLSREGTENEQQNQQPPLTPEQIEQMANQAEAEAMLDDLPFAEDPRGMQNLMNAPRQRRTDGPDW